MIGFLVALSLIVCVLSLPGMVIGMLMDNDQVIGASMAAMAICGSAALILMILAFALTGGEPQFVAGHCYEAVRTEHTGFITVPSGKSVIMVPTHTEGISMQEIECP